MTLSRPQLVLFDLDGTLVDTAPDLAWSLNATLAELDLPLCSVDSVRGWIGSGIEGLLRRALTGDPQGKPERALYDRAHDIFMEIYIDNVCRYSQVYPGVEAALAELDESNIGIACVTNKAARYTEKLLQALSLYDAFGIVVSGDTLAVKKPDPAPLLYAARHFAVAAGETLMVGDSLTDVRAARAAGTAIVCVPYGYNMGNDIRTLKPDAVVDNLAELGGLFQ